MTDGADIGTTVSSRLTGAVMQKGEAMDDTISRQAVVALVEEVENKRLKGEIDLTYAPMIKGINALPSAQQWISCDKGEPDEDMECWVTVKTTDALYRGNFTKRYGERRDKGFITSGGFMWWNTALAWMPIYEPEPWKGEQE